MDRQRIRDQIGALEEQLEKLQEISLSNGKSRLVSHGDFNFEDETLARDALESVQNLHDLFREQSQEKSLPSHDFLKRVISIFIREASAAGIEVSLITSGSGRVSIDMVETSMGAIMACLRASLKSFSQIGNEERSATGLFRTFSLCLEIRASAEEIYFRISDDGRSHDENFLREYETEKNFQKVRTHIARFGGWFRQQYYGFCGGSIEFKIPLSRGRSECLILRGDGFEVLVPISCLAEVRQSASFPVASAGGLLIASLQEEEGLVPVEDRTDYAIAVRLAVADFQFWVRCQGIGSRLRARKCSAEQFVDEKSWLKNFGIFQERGETRILPLLEGEALMKFHLEYGSQNESY